MFDSLKNQLFSSEEFIRLTQSLPEPGSPVILRGASGSLRAFIAAAIFEETGEPLCIITTDRDAAEQLRDDCAHLLAGSMVRLYAADPRHAAQSLDMTPAVSQIETLRALSAGEKSVYITYAEALLHAVPPKDSFLHSVLELETNENVIFQDLMVQLSDAGFERKPIVETYGDFAVRGGIIDVFPYVGDNPVRIEFWGDTIESIREFDILSQRSIRELQKVSIIHNLASSKQNLSGEHRSVALFEYFPDTAIFLTDDVALLENRVVQSAKDGFLATYAFDLICTQLERRRHFQHCIALTAGVRKEIDFQSTPQLPTNGNISILRGHLTSLMEKEYTVIVASDSEEESQRIRELLESIDERRSVHDMFPEPPGADEPEKQLFDPVGVQFLSETFHAGFISHLSKIAFFTEHEVFERLKQRAAPKRRKFKGLSSKEIRALHRGDFIVHIDHGIGKYLGLQKIKVRGVEQEAAKIEYAKQGVLFVNINFINRIQKYSSAEGHVPVLHKLGSGDWEKLKSRAKKKIKDIARDLILLYAKRKNEQGFAFSADTLWQKEMEASFMFEDTPDQARATAEVKADMEMPHPMDRLICGDVGFGKTEVAVRAAFKAVMNNKQAAVLVPTTILAEQHFATFTDRLRHYPVRIERLSRFRTPLEQKKILAALEAGTLDMVIGTHRLLSKDIKFKDLGLLVIDEEQRFGVAAKEKLRALKSSVDTLTLTATPIPRTLHFSLMGARDLSIINTPPRNRLPIETEIAEFNKDIIREAILREIHRGGQIFFVTDRVDRIDILTATLHSIVPEARFRTAHGQMQSRELEKVMLEFMEKKFDVLVTTKIVESGLDIPNSNTIIINRADRFGLAELYQLRGRVGRSNTQAYAYLLVPPIANLPPPTLRRLQAIEEFTELGSGFNLALRDLEIRGAGNMLGGEQSGFIMDMGFEMYNRILEEAVAEIKEKEFSELFKSTGQSSAGFKIETSVDVDCDALIPDYYVENDAERLDFYRRISNTAKEMELAELRSELRDRFGALPEETEQLFAVVSLKLKGMACYFRRIEIDHRLIKFYFPIESEKEFYEGGTFDQVVKKIGEVTGYQLSMQQEIKQLYIRGSLRSIEPMEKIREAELLVERLTP